MDMEIAAPAVEANATNTGSSDTHEPSTPVDAAQPQQQVATDTAAQQNKNDEAKSSSSKFFTADQMRIISNNSKNVGSREEREKWQRIIEEKYNSKPRNVEQTATSTQTQQPTIDEDGLYKKFQERQQREVDVAQVYENTNNFIAKIQASGRAEKIVSSGLAKLSADHPLIPMLNSLENVSDVIDEFDSHPTKLANIVTATFFNPNGAYEALRELSVSLQKNKEAIERAKLQKAPPPPDQLRPSQYGLSGGESTISDKRKSKLLRF